MRRFLTFVLLVALGMQPSGAAMAGTPGRGPLTYPNIGGALAPLFAAVANSQIVAELSGNGTRYALEHAAQPRLLRRGAAKPPNELRLAPTRIAKPHFRVGVAEHIVLPAAPPRKRTRDPRAMHTAQESSGLRPGTARSVFVSNVGNTSGGTLSISKGSHGTLRNSGTHSLRVPTKRGEFKPQLIAATDTGAGINRYWTYEERALPGVGKAMLNVGTGNLLIQATDVDIPERGLDLVMRRTYNSQSLHDANGDDGSEPALFGNGWTNPYDAHLVFRSSGLSLTAISVYDLDGTRCDYTPDGHGNWIPCTGEHAILEVDPSDSCSYWWIKKTGTAYYFRSPDPNQPNCNISQSNVGRLYEVVGRNANNNVTLQYSWSGYPHTTDNITQIKLVHSDGQTMTMTFAWVGGTPASPSPPNELATLTYPDPRAGGNSPTVQYDYDSSGNLVEVDKPGNNEAFDPNNAPYLTGPMGDLPETYGDAQPISSVCGPRATIALRIHPTNPKEGSCLTFDYDSSLRLSDWIVDGVLNFTPGDGQNTVLQPGQTGSLAWYTAKFVYGSPSNPPCSHTNTGTTTMCDTDGHTTVWTPDSSYRVNTTQEFTGEASPTNLVTNETWDANNNLIETTDARGYSTDYAYDANGNTTAVALPGVTDTTVNGNFRALSLYSYDAYNNLVAYCDPWFTHSLGVTWDQINGQSDSLCPSTQGSPSSQGATLYTFNTSDANEPFGRLTQTVTPMGYTSSISYNFATQGGDFGLPTQVQATSPINQFDGTNRTPVQNFTYDGNGNLQTYDRGMHAEWTLLYDNNNRRVATIDPDGYASVSCFFRDGSTVYTETAAQRGYDGGSTITPSSNGNTLCPDASTSAPTPPQYAVAYTYDDDGDVSTETHHYMQGPDVPGGFAAASAGVTNKFYDGLDRLVDVEQPSDPQADRYSFPWITRYIYDLNATGIGPDSVTVDGSSVKAYGGLYQTQECLPTGTTTVTLGPGLGRLSGCSFQELRGNAFDALNRSTQKFEDAFGAVAESTQNYDMDPTTYGLLSKVKNGNANAQYTLFTYDETGRVEQKACDDPSVTPTEQYTFDPDGRTAAIASSLFGNERYKYDYEGHLIENDEPTGNNYTSPGVMTYAYYADGKRQSLSLQISPNPKYNGVPFNGSNVLQYAYQTDGMISNEQVSAGNGGNYTWSYTAADRELAQRDPATGSVIKVYSSKCTINCPSSTVTLGPKKYTYDQYGRIATLTFPSGAAMNGFTYDAEGETINDFGNVQNLAYPPAPQYLYSMRGEMVWSPQAPEGHPNPQWPTTAINHITANGALCIVTCAADTRSGQIVLQSAPDPLSETQPSFGPYTYDKSGRNTATTVLCNYAGPEGPAQQDLGTVTKTYDAENHTIAITPTSEDPTALNTPQSVYNYSQGCYVNAGQNTLAWGNSGHPYLVSLAQTTQNDPESLSYHWDGDQVLYTSDSYGVVTLRLGTLGEVPLSQGYKAPPSQDVVTSDRDYAGQVLQEHTTTVYTAFSPPGARFELQTVKGGPIVMIAPSWGGNTLLALNLPTSIAQRKDGYQIAGVTIQGVRAYDATSSQWSTPDAYSGDAHDPMSQKPFMWNGNDPLTFDDPDGYYVCDGCTADQQKLLDTDTAAGSKVIKHRLGTMKRNDPERALLETLLFDMQKGTTDWHIGFAAIGDTSQLAHTNLTYSLDGETVKGLASTGTTIDSTRFAKDTSSTQIGTLITEGAKFDMSTGRAGSAMYNAMEDALGSDLAGQRNGSPENYLANKFYSLPLHTQLDYPSPNMPP